MFRGLLVVENSLEERRKNLFLKKGEDISLKVNVVGDDHVLKRRTRQKEWGEKS